MRLVSLRQQAHSAQLPVRGMAIGLQEETEDEVLVVPPRVLVHRAVVWGEVPEVL